jgi:response regulator RpfG family c-di-GMP phosphodiesterase
MVPDASTTSQPADSERVKKLRILIVEDHTPTRMAMSRLIRQAGAEVLTARDGEEGLG